MEQTQNTIWKSLGIFVTGFTFGAIIFGYSGLGGQGFISISDRYENLEQKTPIASTELPTELSIDLEKNLQISEQQSQSREYIYQSLERLKFYEDAKATDYDLTLLKDQLLALLDSPILIEDPETLKASLLEKNLLNEFLNVSTGIRTIYELTIQSGKEFTSSQATLVQALLESTKESITIIESSY